MINEAELNAIKGLMHYLNEKDGSAVDLAFDVDVVDSNGETLCRIRRCDTEYQVIFGS